MYYNGWVGKIAWIDLSKEKITIEPIDQYKDWIGGRGLASYLLFEHLPESAEALSAENIIVFSTGPLTGTMSSSSARLNITSKNALTSGYASANAGGFFAVALKRAGFDAIAVKGVANNPVYIFVNEGEIQIRNGNELWGLTVKGVGDYFEKEFSKNNLSYLCIGPAGEKLCKIANVVVDSGRSASYGGLGATMGFKKLKAIVVSGKAPVGIAHPDDFLSIVRKSFDKLMGGHWIKLIRRHGTLITMLGGIDGKGSQVVRNYQDCYWEGQKILKLNPINFEPYIIRRLTCFSCPIECSRLYRFIDREGNTNFFEGLQANHITDLGSIIDVDDLETILRASALVNNLGLDADGVGCSLAWAFECFEKGLLSKDECDGLDLSWGNYKVVDGLILRIAQRVGIGDLLADGALEASRKLGRGSEKYAMHIKGSPLRETIYPDMAWTLGVAVSTRGSGHLNGAVRLNRLQYLNQGESMDSSPETMGRLVAWFENFKSLVDSLGICYFTTIWTDSEGLGPIELAELFRTVTGIKKDSEELLKIGARVQNIEKAFNTLHAGFTRMDDFPPERLFVNAVSNGPHKGSILNKTNWDKLLNAYYEVRQYDLPSGLQKKECLDELEMLSVKDRLASKGMIK